MNIAQFDCLSPVVGVSTTYIDQDIIPPTTRLDTLPLEITRLILSYLDSRPLLCYFNSSRFTLVSSTRFPPWQLLFSYTNSILEKRRAVEDLVVSAYREFGEPNYVAFDGLLLWVQRLDCLSRLLKVRSSSGVLSFCDPPSLSLVTGSPLRHQHRHQQLLASVTDRLQGLNVYSILVHGRRYVCGLEGIPSTTHIFIGDCRGIPNAIFFRYHDKQELGFIVDSLGVRSLRVGDSEWSSGSLFDLKCFEGMGIADSSGDTKLAICMDVSSYFHIYFSKLIFLGFKTSLYSLATCFVWHNTTLYYRCRDESIKNWDSITRKSYSANRLPCW